MKKFYIITLVLFSISVKSQSIVTGDTLSAGIVYTNIKDSSIIAFPNGTSLADFDIDGDLIKDLRVHMVQWVPPGYMTLNKWIYSLNNLDVAAIPSSTAMADTMSVGSLIDQSLTWSNASGGIMLFGYSSVGSTVTTNGLFNSINKYLAFRIKLPTDTIYGWLLMDFPNLGTIKVRSWAYKSKPLGIKNVSNIPGTVSVFPIPAFNELNIICKGQLIKEITLLNFLGEEILKQRQEISSENFTIDISRLKTGIYFLQLSTKDSIFTKKIIKE